MSLKLVTPPSAYPVSRTEAKAHLRVDHTDDDTLIDALIAAATDSAQKFLGRALIDQTWDYYADEFPDAGEVIELPLPPVISVTGVFYLDSNGDEQEFAAASYTVDVAGHPSRIIVPASGAWPTIVDDINATRVRFRAGYLDTNSPPAAAVPPAIKAAILMMIGTLYEHRETIVIGQTAMQLPWAAEQLLRQYRFDLSMA